MDILDHDLYEQKQLLKKYKKPIARARVYTFILTSLFYLLIIFIFLLYRTQHAKKIDREVIVEVCVTTLLIVLNAICYFKPFIIFLIQCIIFAFTFTVYISDIATYVYHMGLYNSSYLPILITVVMPVFLLLLAVYLSLRATISAYKYERLFRLIKTTE